MYTYTYATRFNDKQRIIFVYIQDGARAIFASGAALDTLISDIGLKTGILYYQLVTAAGVHRVYPGMTVANDYNPFQEAW